MADDAQRIAKELFGMLMNAANSASRNSRGNSNSKQKTKEEKDYEKNFKKQNDLLKKTTRAHEIREQVVGKQYEKIIKRLERFDDSIDDFVTNTKSLKDLDKIPEAVNKIFKESSSAYVKGLASHINSLEDVFKMQDLADEKIKLIQSLKMMSNRQKLTVEEFDALQQSVKNVGTTLEDLGIESKKQYAHGKQTGHLLITTNQNLSRLEQESKDLSNAFGSVTTTVGTQFKNSMGKAVDGMVDYIKQLGSLNNLIHAVRAAQSDFKKQREFSAADTTQGLANDLKVNLSELIDTFVQNRGTLLALDSGGRDAKKVLKENIDAFKDVSGTPLQALQNLVAAERNAAQFGVAQKDLGNAAKDQLVIWDKHYRALGVSVAQFNEMSEQMTNDENIRQQLAGLNSKERKARMESIQVLQAQNIATYGTTKAMDVLKKQQEMAAMSPMKRYRTAMLAESIFGMVGKASLGAEYRKLMLMNPANMTAEQTKRKTEIEAEVSAAWQKQKSTDLYGAMQTEAAVNATGTMNLDELFNVNKDMAQGNVINAELAKQQLETDGKVNSTLSKLDITIDRLNSFLESSYVQLIIAGTVAGVTTILGSKIAGKGIEKAGELLSSKGKPSAGGLWDKTKGMAKGAAEGAAGVASKLGRVYKPLALAAGAYGAYEMLSAEKPLTQQFSDYVDKNYSSKSMLEQFGQKPNNEAELKSPIKTGEQFKAPSQQPDSVVLLGAKTTQMNQEKLSQQSKQIDKLEEQIIATKTVVEEIQLLRSEIKTGNKIAKQGHKESKEAVDYQTNELKKTQRKSDMEITRGASQKP